MQPLILTLEGFIGVRNGLGRDKITINLEALPSGLIALKGSNGRAKTTIVDNAQPYRIMPSRATRLSVDAFSYWDNIFGARAAKVLEWTHAGVRYRSTFEFRKTGKAGKAEYYLAWRNLAGEWEAMTTPDGCTSDGKAESYDRCVEAICGSLEQFFTSVFSAQNRRPLASYGASEIKGLLAELLKVDELQRQAVLATDVSKRLMKALDVVQAEVKQFSTRRDRLSEVTRVIQTRAVELAAAKEARERFSGVASSLGLQRASLRAKQEENAVGEVRLRELSGRSAELTAQIALDKGRERTGYQRIDARRAEVGKSIAAHRHTYSQAAAVSAAEAQRTAALHRISQGEARVRDLERQIKEIEDTPITVKTLEAEVASLQKQGKAEKVVMLTFKQQADGFAAAPCRSMAVHQSCPLFAAAAEASAKYAEQYDALKLLGKIYVAKQEQHDAMLPLLARLNANRTKLEEAKLDLRKSQRDLQQATELAARAPVIAQAKEGLAASELELTSLDVQRAEVARFHGEAVKRLSEQLRQVDAEIGRLAGSDVAAEIAAIDLQCQTNREHLARVEGEIEALIRSLALGHAEADRLNVELAGSDATQARANQLSDEIAGWKLLAKGLGNDGVIALTIDDAGPTLAQLTNDLLLACYGPRFTVQIRTQRALATGELREGFEILVHDADSDSSTSVGMLSGGEKVWINEALTRGIALYIARTGGQPYTTLFTDETDGPLDPDRKRQFMKMKREVLKQGGLEREFFITHTPELIEGADAIIDFEALVA